MGVRFPLVFMVVFLDRIEGMENRFITQGSAFSAKVSGYSKG